MIVHAQLPNGDFAAEQHARAQPRANVHEPALYKRKYAARHGAVHHTVEVESFIAAYSTRNDARERYDNMVPPINDGHVAMAGHGHGGRTRPKAEAAVLRRAKARGSTLAILHIGDASARPTTRCCAPTTHPVSACAEGWVVAEAHVRGIACRARHRRPLEKRAFGRVHACHVPRGRENPRFEAPV